MWDETPSSSCTHIYNATGAKHSHAFFKLRVLDTKWKVNKPNGNEDMVEIYEWLASNTKALWKCEAYLGALKYSEHTFLLSPELCKKRKPQLRLCRFLSI